MRCECVLLDNIEPRSSLATIGLIYHINYISDAFERICPLEHVVIWSMKILNKLVGVLTSAHG